MKKLNQKTTVLIFVFLFAIVQFAPAQNVKTAEELSIREQNVRAHMNFLASDAMQGRGSGTMFELLAGQYLASQMQQYGIEPAGDKDSSGKKSYIQTVDISRYTFAEAPSLTYVSNGNAAKLTHGKEMIVVRTDSEKASGKLQKIYAGENAKSGSVAFVRLRKGEDPVNLAQSIGNLFGSGASAIVMVENARWRSRWARSASRPIRFSKFGKNTKDTSPTLLVVNNEAAAALEKVADGTDINIGGKLDAPEVKNTWNAVGMIKGSDPKLSSEVILLSAPYGSRGCPEKCTGQR